MTEPEPAPAHRRRPRYRGKNPRRFEEKYKEHNPARYPQTVAQVLASGKTPAGSHRPIMVEEVLAALAPQPGEFAVDCTLGYGGHAAALLPHLLPGGHLLGLDVDPRELPRAEARLRSLGFGAEAFTALKSNFAGLPQALLRAGREGTDVVLADLGVSSMQLDDPTRGFSAKEDGPLDLRMNPDRGQSAAALLAALSPERLVKLLQENADEPHALALASALAGKHFPGTHSLGAAIAATLPQLSGEDAARSIRRVLQALRIEVNDEFSALETLLRHLPTALRPSARVAIISFHSGEDRRVKKAFAAGLRDGIYEAIAGNVIRADIPERRANPRSTAARLRWAKRTSPH